MKGDQKVCWKQTRLGDHFQIKHGYALKGKHFAEEGPFIVLTPGNFFDEGGFKRKEQEKYYTGEVPDGYVLSRGDLLVAMTEQAHGLLGSSAIIPEDDVYLHNQRLGLVVDLDESTLDRRFLYYLFNTRRVRDQIQATATGTKVRHTSPSRICDGRVALPPLLVQRCIADVLSAYNDLIENNTRRIAILEEMAQAIYREWFVNFRFPGHEQVEMVESELGPVPAGWEVKPLKHFVANIRDSRVAGLELHNLHYVPIDCITPRSLALREAKPGSEAQSSLIAFERGDILFGAMRSYLHKVTVAPFAGTTRSTCFVLRPHRENCHAFAAVTAIDARTIEYSHKHARGTTIPYAVWEGSLAEMPVTSPPDQLLGAFQELVHPMLEWVQGTFARQRNLRQTRDLLLPRLISGEIDVAAMEEELAGTG